MLYTEHNIYTKCLEISLDESTKFQEKTFDFGCAGFINQKMANIVYKRYTR